MENFEFLRWKAWLEGKSLTITNVEVEFGSNDEHLQGFWIGLIGRSALGSLRCYANGFVDFEVLEKRSGKHAANETMIEVSDVNFETTFSRFMIEFQKVNECA